ncbi:MAG: hypothetical protein INR62_03100 [Rhodospirillales bacterium]|nr:hypothetical protein [Acetobacter sp.]
MKTLVFIASVFVVLGVRNVHCEGMSNSSGKMTTLSELSKLPSVKVTIEKLPRPEDAGDEEWMPGIPRSALPKTDYDIPRNAVKILFFPGATIFNPDFFEKFGEVFSPASRPLFPSDLKLYLAIRGTDQTELARVPLVYNIVADTDGSLHFKITFSIASEAMKNSYLVIDDYPASTHYVAMRTRVYFEALPDQK